MGESSRPQNTLYTQANCSWCLCEMPPCLELKSTHLNMCVLLVQQGEAPPAHNCGCLPPVVAGVQTPACGGVPEAGAQLPAGQRHTWFRHFPGGRCRGRHVRPHVWPMPGQGQAPTSSSSGCFFCRGRPAGCSGGTEQRQRSRSSRGSTAGACGGPAGLLGWGASWRRSPEECHCC